VARSIVILILLLLLGLLGVIGVAFGVNAATAKFPALIRVNMRTLNVRYNAATGEVEQPNGGALEITPLLSSDVIDPSATQRVRRFTTKEGLTFEASAGRGPVAWLLGLFTGPRAYVSAAGSVLIVGPKNLPASSSPVRIPMNLHNLSVFKVASVDAQDRSGDEFMLSSDSGVRFVYGTLSVLMLTGADGRDGGSEGLRQAVAAAARGIQEHIAEVIGQPNVAGSQGAAAATSTGSNSSSTMTIDDIDI